MTAAGTPAQHWVRWTGTAFLVGVLFLLQELLRTLIDIANVQSRVNPQLGGSGWLDMSGAATPAAWLYFAGHLWILFFLLKWRTWPAIGRAEWIVFGLLTASIIGVHVVVLGPLHNWIIRPRLF